MKTVSVSEIIRTAQMVDTRYVLKTEAEAEIAALRERQRVLVEALESMIVVCKEPQSYDFVKVAEIIRAALAAKEG